MDHPLYENLQRDLPAEEQEEISAQIRATQAKLPYVNLKKFSPNLDVLKLLPIHEAQTFRLVPYAKQGQILKVALTMLPTGPAKTRLVRLKQQSGYEIEMNIVSPGSLNYLLDFYSRSSSATLPETETQPKTAEQKLDPIEDIKTLADVQKNSKTTNTTLLLDIIIAGALNTLASDIHIEPAEADFTVRYRLDGVLYNVVRLPQTLLHGLISRIKILASLRLDLDDIPQDGGFEKQFGKIRAALRVSFLPTQFGQAVVARIARNDLEFIQLEHLGFSAHDLERVKKATEKTQGVLLVSGPTGSGKTSTLYAILNEIKSLDKKIITLEDPIEYNIAGVEQSQISTRSDYSFAEALREVLRQDPNIIMVGEVRDRETADVAFDAAITGHLVLTTMHATSAVQTLARLLDLGVKTNLISGSINLIINQRLVRKICPHCQGKKCPKCNNIGYLGRTVLAETLVLTPEFERAVFARSDNATLLDLAQKAGLKTIAEDGEEKVALGLTTKEEVERVSN